MVLHKSDEDLALGPKRPSQGAKKTNTPKWRFESIPGQLCKLSAQARSVHGIRDNLAGNSRPNGKHCQIEPTQGRHGT